MKPVYQTLTHVDPINGKFGNCFQACIASVLELPLDDVPHFAQLACEREIARGVPPEKAVVSSTDWWYMMNDWLAPRGLYYVEFTSPKDDSLESPFHPDIEAKMGYHLIVGRSPRGEFDHVVVGHAGKIVHDPREGADAPHVRTIRAYGLFIPANPANGHELRTP